MPKIGAGPSRRIALRNAVIEEIGACGSLDFTVAHVAQRAGMSSALAHHYYGAKDGILLAGLHQLTTSFTRDLQRGQTDNCDPRKKIDAIMGIVFSPRHFRQATACAWVAYQMMARTSVEAKRLASICTKSLRVSLNEPLRALTPSAVQAVEGAIAMIDGLYIGHGSGSRRTDPRQAVLLMRSFFDGQLSGPTARGRN